MMDARTFFGRLHAIAAIDPGEHAVLLTIAIPIRDAGPALTDLAGFHAGMTEAPIAVALQVGQIAAALRACLSSDMENQP